MKTRILLFAAFVVLANCSHKPDVRDTSNELALLNSGQAQMNAQKYEAALGTFKKFQELYPYSIYSSQVRLEEGKSKLRLNEYPQAESILRDISVATKDIKPEISASALFYLGLAYEGMGDDVRATASLLDAERMGASLDPAIAKGELPAKLATIYVRHGHTKTAISYLDKAEKGIESLKALDPKYANKNYSAELFYRMGSIFGGELEGQNVEARIQSLKLVQLYLFKSMRLDVSPWSTRSKETLLENYRNFMFLFNGESELSRKLEIGTELMALFEQAEMFKSTREVMPFPAEKEVFSYVEEMKNKVAEVLYKPRTYVNETTESENLNKVRRAGIVNVDTLLPEEEVSIPLPPKVISEEDPNL